MNKNIKAFTLIELLVVIAIIAILAAILFPVFAQAKLAAKKTVALSNMKNLATAEQIYQSDYDDSFVKSFFGAPASCADGSGNGSGWGAPGLYTYTWRHALYSYSKSPDILRDSTNTFSAKTYDQDKEGVVNAPDNTDKLTLSNNFAANDAIIGFGNPGCWGFSPDEPGGKDNATSIDAPASTIMFWPSRQQYQDGHWYWGSNDSDGNLFYVAGDHVAFPDGSQTMASGLCLTGGCPAAGFGPINAVGRVINFAWADGHAKAESYAASLKTSDATSDDWGATAYTKDTAGNFISQAERQYAASHTFNEYK